MTYEGDARGRMRVELVRVCTHARTHTCTHAHMHTLIQALTLLSYLACYFIFRFVTLCNFCKSIRIALAISTRSFISSLGTSWQTVMLVQHYSLLVPMENNWRDTMADESHDFVLSRWWAGHAWNDQSTFSPLQTSYFPWPPWHRLQRFPHPPSPQRLQSPRQRCCGFMWSDQLALLDSCDNGVLGPRGDENLAFNKVIAFICSM